MSEEPPVAWLARSQRDRLKSVEARHRIFCEGGGGEVLEQCQAETPVSPHDEYDIPSLHFGVDYCGETIATARLILGTSLEVLPTGRLLPRLADVPTIVPGRCYSEPSRLGMLAEYQGTRVGFAALLRLIGLLAETSYAQGYGHYLLSLRGALLKAVPWFPWELTAPFDYPPSEGGPIIHEPIWLGTLDLHEMAIATMTHNLTVYSLMFPSDIKWESSADVRSTQAMRRLARSNRRVITAQMHAWEAGQLLLPDLRGA